MSDDNCTTPYMADGCRGPTLTICNCGKEGYCPVSCHRCAALTPDQQQIALWRKELGKQ